MPVAVSKLDDTVEADYARSMVVAAQDRKRLLMVGLPRSGTTLLATLLAAQPHVRFSTDYFPAFLEVLTRIGKRWGDALTPDERRLALAVVRDQLLRARHVVLVRADDFATLDELHRAVMDELAAPTDRIVGHKLLMRADELQATLEQTDIHCLLAYRDPRDAALSFQQRTGGGVEHYLHNWRQMLTRFVAGPRHPRLLPLKFEALLLEPERTLERVGSWLGVPISAHVPELRFVQSRAGAAVTWRENSAFDDVAQRFDPRPIGRFKSRLDSPVVRYASFVTRRELARFGYEPCALALGAGERARFACLSALARAEEGTYDVLERALDGARRRLWRGL